MLVPRRHRGLAKTPLPLCRCNFPLQFASPHSNRTRLCRGSAWHPKRLKSDVTVCPGPSCAGRVRGPRKDRKRVRALPLCHAILCLRQLAAPAGGWVGAAGGRAGGTCSRTYSAAHVSMLTAAADQMSLSLNSCLLACTPVDMPVYTPASAAPAPLLPRCTAGGRCHPRPRLPAALGQGAGPAQGHGRAVQAPTGTTAAGFTNCTTAGFTTCTTADQLETHIHSFICRRGWWCVCVCGGGRGGGG